MLVTIDVDRANLLELMLASLLRRRLTDERAAAHARALAGAVSIEAGEMHASLAFGGGRIAVTRERHGHPAARIRGSLPAVIDAALGRQRVANLVHRRLQVRGSPRVLWHLLALLRGGSG